MNEAIKQVLISERDKAQSRYNDAMTEAAFYRQKVAYWENQALAEGELLAELKEMLR